MPEQSAACALKTLRGIAEEAARTPITREDMHDHLKALTAFDERQGLINAILQQTGDDHGS